MNSQIIVHLFAVTEPAKLICIPKEIVLQCAVAMSARKHTCGAIYRLN